MKKYVFLIVGLFLVSGQSLSAAAAGEALEAPRGQPGRSTFLDGYDPQVREDTVLHYIAPFCNHFIGDKRIPRGIGWASHGLTMIREGEVSAENEPAFNGQIADCRLVLGAPEGCFEVITDFGKERKAWRAHEVSDVDRKIAEALYDLINDEEIKQYDQLEGLVWDVLPPILGISKKPSEVDPKNLAAMDLWTFLTAIELSAWPYSPPVPRLSKPPYGPDVFPCANKVFLATMFNRLVTAYQAA